jgi:hypothetical protein
MQGTFLHAVPDLQVSRAACADGVCADYYRFAYHAAGVLVRDTVLLAPNVRGTFLRNAPDLK